MTYQPHPRLDRKITRQSRELFRVLLALVGCAELATLLDDDPAAERQFEAFHRERARARKLADQPLERAFGELRKSALAYMALRSTLLDTVPQAAAQ